MEQNRTLSKLPEDKYTIDVANKTTNKNVLRGFFGFSCPVWRNFSREMSKQTIEQQLTVFIISNTRTASLTFVVDFTKGLQILDFSILMSKQLCFPHWSSASKSDLLKSPLRKRKLDNVVNSMTDQGCKIENIRFYQLLLQNKSKLTLLWGSIPGMLPTDLAGMLTWVKDQMLPLDNLCRKNVWKLPSNLLWVAEVAYRDPYPIEVKATLTPTLPSYGRVGLAYPKIPWWGSIHFTTLYLWFFLLSLDLNHRN